MPAGVAHIEINRVDHVLAGMPDARSNWMTESEQVRLAGIGNDERRAQYLAGHWLTRLLLARAFGSAPQTWRLLERKGQPPQVYGHDDELRVSISHSGDWIAAAVADLAIGIDLEQRPRLLDASIEPLLRNADEVPGSLDPDVLLQRWVAKEAWIKRIIGSALPARMNQLHLQAAVHDRANVTVDSHVAFHFGLAVSPGCTVGRQCPEAMTQGMGFLIVDLEPETASR